MLNFRLKKWIVFSVFPLLLFVVLFSNQLWAAGFPKREIKIIVPWSPGGSTDIMSRKLQPVFKKMGVDVVIVNKPGGSSAVGLTEVITSKPDGYTVGVASSTILSLIAQKKINWGLNRFDNIVLVSEDPVLLLVKGDSKWKNIDDFMADVKKNPGKITIGTPGSRNVNHAIAMLAAQSVNGKIRQVPFKGGSVVISNLMGGHIDAAVLKPSETINQIKDGNLRALAVNKKKRLDVLPNVPTFAEKGYNVAPYGPVSQVSFVMAPAGLKKDVKEKLSQIFRKACLSKDFQDFSKKVGFVCDPITGAELDKEIKGIGGALAVVANKIFK